MTNTMQKWRNRESGIELLRLIAMFMIVLSHTLMSLCNASKYVSNNGYVFPINIPTYDLRTIVLVMLRHCGNLGSTVFFICSAWFLIGKEKVDKKKWIRLLLDTWVISVLIFGTVYLINHGTVIMESSNSFAPFLFCNNWFISCYLLFLVVAPFFNMIVSSLPRKTFFRLVLFMSTIMLFMGFFLQRDFFTSTLVVWFVVYFDIAYIKLYKQEWSTRAASGWGLFLIGFVGLLGSVLFFEWIGKTSDAPQLVVLFWNVDCNPYIIFMAMGLFILFRNIHFQNIGINYLASLSLLVYLIHENIIIRACYRPRIWKEIYSRWGYEMLVSKLFLVSLCVFAASLFISVIYDKTIRKVLVKVANRLYDLGRELYLKFEKKAISE